jgi:hypothetical protein
MGGHFGGFHRVQVNVGHGSKVDPSLFDDSKGKGSARWNPPTQNAPAPTSAGGDTDPMQTKGKK